MPGKSKLSFVIAAVVFAGSLLAKPTTAQDAALASQLQAEYKLAKMGLDSSGWSVVTPGTVLVIQKGGVLGVPPANLAMPPATYKDGELHGPNAFMAASVANVSRQLVAGEKVYPIKIDVHGNKIMFTIVECDACNGVQQPSTYKSAVIFEFPKDYLGKADPGQIKDVIAQVLAPAQDAGRAASAEAPTQQQAPAANQPAAQPATIEPGQTIDQVVGALGQPEKIVNLGKKQIYVYKDLKITFIDGKVSDVQ
jgi:hypothetical protein